MFCSCDSLPGAKLKAGAECSFMMKSCLWLMYNSKNKEKKADLFLRRVLDRKSSELSSTSIHTYTYACL